MMLRLSIALALIPVLAATQEPAGRARGDTGAIPAIELRPGLVITRSVRIIPRTYRFGGRESLDSALITIRGSNITVDFQNATLQGIEPEADPDLAQGVAVHVDGGRNVRIRNVKLRGYRFGIIARGTRNLNILDSDLSFNWKPRLFSLVEHESLVDWLSFHKNEKGEWLRFGAAIYLDSVRGGEIKGVRAEQGMNGILMSNTAYVRIWNSVLSFNSGLGVGLYRSTRNTIVHNHVEFNVRGYSHGRYRRGQDSAGILVYEQSSDNLVAYNSVTHGGDGFFLWAGQSTMDTGAGGANDNVVYGNDFSYAPTNGIEATFSRNLFMANRVTGSDHGVWGGYSFESRFIANTFARNRIGMAIEHGQSNVIAANSFDGDSTAVSLWANRIEPSDWGYPKHRDTRSRDTRLEGNVFKGHRTGVRASATQSLILGKNRFFAVDSMLVLDDSSRGLAIVDTLAVASDSSIKPTIPDEYLRLVPSRLEGGLDPSASSVARMDRSAIVVDEWGPFDWQYPKLWPVDSTRANPIRLRVIGPRGAWTIVEKRGIESISAEKGRVGDTIAVTPAADSSNDWALALQFTGAATRSSRGTRKAAGTPVRFSYTRFEPRVEWRTKIYDTSPDSAKEPDMSRVLTRTPLVDTLLPRLDYQWFRPTAAGIPRERWALEASARVQVPEGEHTLRTISDDGIRVWIDGTLVIDSWASHESAVNHVAITPGTHDLRVQYYQREGWTELRVEIVRGAQRSTGSPGPH